MSGNRTPDVLKCLHELQPPRRAQRQDNNENKVLRVNWITDPCSRHILKAAGNVSFQGAKIFLCRSLWGGVNVLFTRTLY